MNARYLCYLWLVFCTMGQAVETTQKILRNEDFDKLTIRQAGIKARKMAIQDFDSGRFVYLTWTKEGDYAAFKDNDYLKKNYGVEFLRNWIKQTDPMLNAIDAYNETMATLLKKKFGKDIFKEAGQRNER